MTTLQRSTFTSVVPAKSQAAEASKAADKSILEDMQMITHLLDLGQVLCQKMHGEVAHLCHEVSQITQERAHLRFGRERALKRVQIPLQTLITLPVRFGNLFYGALYITFDPIHTELSSIPLPIAQLLAQTCGWLLYTLEQSIFLQGQCQQLEYQVDRPLTKREREVLQLMYRGCNQDKIAEALCIAPATVGKHRQHIYERLGVHNERDALLAAYHSGVLSLIEETVM